jgi:CBS domain-containing protein
MTKQSKQSSEQTLTVGQIAGSNDVVFYESQNALGVAAQLLSGRISGAPVVNAEREFIGFISEFDVLNALEAR